MKQHSSTDTSPPPSRNRFRKIASIALAIVLLVIVIASASIPDLIDAIQDVDLRLLAAAYAFNVVMIGLMAYRWQLLYQIHDEAQRPSYRQILSVSFMGVFFNNFLPSTIGGDAYRTVYMSRARPHDGISGSLSIVYVDRVMGLLGMALVGLVALVLSVGQVELPSAVVFWIGLLFAGLTLGLILSLNPRFHNPILRLLSSVLGQRGQQWQIKVRRLFEQLVAFSSRRSLLMKALSLSVILRVIWIVGCYLVGLSLNIDVPFVAFLVAIPLIELIRMIPITVQGIGIREGLFVLFFAYYGVSTPDATLLAVLVYLLLNLNGIVGGFLFIANQRDLSKQKSDTTSLGRSKGLESP